MNKSIHKGPFPDDVRPKYSLFFYTYTSPTPRPRGFNPAPGDTLSYNVYSQPASAHLACDFSRDHEDLAGSSVFDQGTTQ